MVKKLNYNEFEASCPTPISQALLNAVEMLIRHDSGVSRRCQWLIATYFSGANVKIPVEFRFMQQHRTSRVSINGIATPIFDEYEGKLYGHLFQEYIRDSYTFDACAYYNYLSHCLINLRKFIEPFIEMNMPLGILSLRWLRIHALINDYDIRDENLIRSYFGYKTWAFRLIPIGDKFLADEVGIKVSPND